ncbi:MAG: DUF3341 domain-containing protein [bacterium]|nr:DUF3341 domain-containing protein [bacterium]
MHALPRARYRARHGLKPSRIPIACLVFGLFGAALMFWFQVWASAIDWPAASRSTRPAPSSR